MSCRARSPRLGMTLTRNSPTLPSTGVQSRRQPGVMDIRREISAGMVTMFFVVTVVRMAYSYVMGPEKSRHKPTQVVDMLHGRAAAKVTAR